MPLLLYNEELYAKRFNKERPDIIRWIERIANGKTKIKEQRKNPEEEKRMNKQSVFDEVPF